ncbi:histidine phosphatase family protein [Thalassobaculum sp.]|uniref:histidine phosphatase family protein n=1 Tax=Thalassobaculum sp. TaxID=2022740 RepID=UPI0032ED176E
MRVLHLVKHAPVTVDFGVPSQEWRLAPDAPARINSFAERFRNCGLHRVVASTETKATATGRIMAERLDLPLEIRDGLEEHHRLVAQQTRGAEAFAANVRRFFAQPDEVVFGAESASAARVRFRSAVETIMGETADDELIVSHGTVMTLLIAEGGNGEPMDIWSSLRLPDHVALDWPSLKRIDR